MGFGSRNQFTPRCASSRCSSVHSRRPRLPLGLNGLAAGGVDDGAPGLRAHYHPSYYGAFLLDPDGNRVEAVCHHPHTLSC